MYMSDVLLQSVRSVLDSMRSILDLRHLCSTIKEGLHLVEIVNYSRDESLRTVQHKAVVL